MFHRFLFFILLLSACSKKEAVIEDLKTKTEIPEILCPHVFPEVKTGDDTAQAYNFSIAKWKLDTIKYYLDFENVKDEFHSRYERGVIDGFCMWQPHVNIVFKRVFDRSHANIVSKVTDTIFMINKSGEEINVAGVVGGVLGLAQFPPQNKYVEQQIWVKFDRVDLEFFGFNFSSIAAHEIGHSLGLAHSNLQGAIMQPTYSDFDSLNIDDILGIRNLYKQKDFTLNGDEFIWVSGKKENNYFGPKGRTIKNFSLNEFYTRCREIQIQDGHFMRLDVMKAAQIIRDYIKSPVWVISSYRHQHCNEAIGSSASQSKHQRAEAIDFKVKRSAYNMIVKDYQTKGPLYQKLLANKVRGFGVYSGSFHIDVRNQEKPAHWGFSFR